MMPPFLANVVAGRHVLIRLLLFFGARIPALTSFNLRRTLMERAARPQSYSSH